MNKNTPGPLAVVLVGVAAFATMLAFAEQPTSCPCNTSSNPWYPCLQNPCPMQTLTMTSYQINTPTNLTLNLMNPGNAAVALIAYYVKDSSGDQYANSNLVGTNHRFGLSCLHQYTHRRKSVHIPDKNVLYSGDRNVEPLLHVHNILSSASI